MKKSVYAVLSVFMAAALCCCFAAKTQSQPAAADSQAVSAPPVSSQTESAQPVSSQPATAQAQPAPAENKASVDFPAYKLENNDPPYVNSFEQFTVSLTLPEGWSLSEKYSGEPLPPAELYTPVYLYNGETLMGYIGFDVFEPYTGEIPPEEYYKTVYPKLRLSSIFCWEPYTAVKTTDNGETGLAEIHYAAPEQIAQHPGAKAEIPESKADGILCYDKALGVYIGIAFVPNAIDESGIKSIAESVTLSAK